MLSFKVTLHDRAVSVNELYQIGKRRDNGKCYLFLHPVAAAFKMGNVPRVRKFVKELGQEWEGNPIIQTVKIYDRWLDGDGYPLRMDSDNPLKVIQDTVAEGVGIDDRWVFKTTVEKVHSDSPFPYIVITWKEKPMKGVVRGSVQQEKSAIRSRGVSVHKGRKAGSGSRKGVRKTKRV